ncbi:hypothetical protein DL93DRAFT_2222735 [Clavulina sp. PMI_390]|nr:hypothetical protein DL93DRAFT_2222735 [Clavulina sp. PMI_390]
MMDPSWTNQFFRWQAVAFVAAVAVVTPLIWKLLSPIVLILLAPLFLVILGAAFVFINIAIPFLLDSRASKRRVRQRPGHAAQSFLFSTPAAWQAVLTRSQWSFTSPHSLPPLIPGSPSVSASLNDIIVLIVRDFVLSWYRSISPSPSFPASVSNSVRHSVKSILDRLDKVDVPALMVKRVLPIVNSHIDQFCESEKALRGVGLERRLTQSDELDLVLASRYATRGGKRLHPAVDNLSTMLTRPTEEAYLRDLVERVLPLVLPPEEAGSRAVHVIAREILTTSVLVPLLEMLGDPDFWNRIIDQFAGAAINEQKLVHKVRHLLDSQTTAGSPSSQPVTSDLSLKRLLRAPGELTQHITARTGARQFEAFLKGISRIDSLLDARRLKNDIVAEIRRTQELIQGHPDQAEVNGERIEALAIFLERLQAAKRKVEKRITMLGGADNSGQSMVHGRASTTSHDLPLREILSTPSSLSYFMEFMDRRQRSLLVQFWLTVESFKDPLESAGYNLDATDASRSLPATSHSIEDIKLIYDLYFAGQGEVPTPVLRAVSPRHVDDIRAFVFSESAETPEADTEVTSSGIDRAIGARAREAVLLAQKQVEEAMGDDFQEFRRSELWFRVTSELLRAGRPLDAGSSGHPNVPEVGSAESSPPQSPPLARVPLSHSITAPNLTPRPRGTNRTFETVRSRIYPTFILPASAEASTALASPISPTDVNPSGPVTRPSLSRGRLQSFGSDAGSTFSTATSPLLSNSVESLPPPASTAPPRTRQQYRSALDFLTSSPGESENAANSNTRAPLFSDPEIVAEETAQAERVEAIQAALTDLIADEHREADDVHRKESSRGSLQWSPKSEKRVLFPDDLVERPRHVDVVRRGTDLLRPPNVHTEQSVDDDSERPNVPLAGPGDLLLSQDILRLGDQISKFQSQEVLLDALIRKAELTGDLNELRVLSRSKASLAKEIRELSFQKTQYEEQEKDNKLVPGRTRINITSSSTIETDAKQVIRYTVEVRQMSPDDTLVSHWTVLRRYNEFFVLHQRLKERYVAVRSLDFPGKRLVTALSNSFVDSRKSALEKYLQNLINMPLICESEEFLAFLSRQTTFNEAGTQIGTKLQLAFPGQEIVRTVYRSVAESFDDMFVGPAMLDLMIQRLSRQAAEFAGIAGSGAHDEDLVANAVKSPDETLLQMPGELKALDGELGTSSFTTPICDLVLSVFELDQKKNWLRRQAVLVILQQVLGGTLERKLREAIHSLFDDTHVLRYLQSLRDTLWPGGQWRSASAPRTTSMKAQTREDANKKLAALVPDLAGNMIGASNAKRGARRLFAVLQNRRLNQHIVYTVMDEIVEALFPEALPSGMDPPK